MEKITHLLGPPRQLSSAELVFQPPPFLSSFQLTDTFRRLHTAASKPRQDTLTKCSTHFYLHGTRKAVDERETRMPDRNLLLLLIFCKRSIAPKTYAPTKCYVKCCPSSLTFTPTPYMAISYSDLPASSHATPLSQNPSPTLPLTTLSHFFFFRLREQTRHVKYRIKLDNLIQISKKIHNVYIYISEIHPPLRLVSLFP